MMPGGVLIILYPVILPEMMFVILIIPSFACVTDRMHPIQLSVCTEIHPIGLIANVRHVLFLVSIALHWAHFGSPIASPQATLTLICDTYRESHVFHLGQSGMH